MNGTNRYTSIAESETPEAKYWLEVAGFQVVEAHAYNLSPADKRTVRRIIFEHFDYIVSEWNKFEVKKHG